jgi:predicted HicB family RNase H-like nuclease
MADKSSSDHPGNIPKKPPKRPTRDYSTLPQRPITLKQASKKKSVKKKRKVSAESKPATAPVKKAVSKKAMPKVKKKPSGQWLLKGISESTRQYAQEEAERQGLTLEAWIEQLILSQLQPDSSEQDDESNEVYIEGDLEQIAESLFAIEQRLDRMEEQRGFWRRFWEQVINQAKS